jgi:antitoxin component of MazEF toxin-antitoxin module
MTPTLIITAVSAAIAGVAGFGLAWQLQAGNISEINLEHANERITIQRAARQTLERHQATLAEAQADAAKRNVRVRTDADNSRNAGNGLRIASVATVRAAADDPSTCNSIITAYDAVVSASADFIRDVSRDADQCHSDVQMMQEAWPK